MLWKWEAATDRFCAFRFVSSRVGAVSHHLLPACPFYRPMEGPSGRGLGVDGCANAESGVPLPPPVRTRQPGAAPIEGTARSRASRARGQAGEARVRAGRPVLVLSPEKMERNKKLAVDKARSLANIAARKRAAAAPVWHAAAVLPPSIKRSMMAAAASAAAAKSDSEEILAEGWAAPAPLPCPPPSYLCLSSLPPPVPQHSRPSRLHILPMWTCAWRVSMPSCRP